MQLKSESPSRNNSLNNSLDPSRIFLNFLNRRLRARDLKASARVVIPSNEKKTYLGWF